MKILDYFLFGLFFILNWMVDVLRDWALPRNICTDNGFVAICNTTLFYHLFWYLSIMIFFYFAVRYFNEVNKKC